LDVGVVKIRFDDIEGFVFAIWHEWLLPLGCGARRIVGAESLAAISDFTFYSIKVPLTLSAKR
jgi:hypothetical protein